MALHLTSTSAVVFEEERTCAPIGSLLPVSLLSKFPGPSNGIDMEYLAQRNTPRLTLDLSRRASLKWKIVTETRSDYDSLNKYLYENTPIQIYRKFHLQKTENFQIKHSDIFHISAQNIDCGHLLELPRRGGSNEYPQPMFSSRNKKNNVYPCKPQFYYT